MSKSLRLPQAILAAFALLTAVSLYADTIQVTELGHGAREIVKIDTSTRGVEWVYAGVVKLDVDDIAMDAFCIDPWHLSDGTALSYELEPLANAPKSANETTPNPMGAAAAKQISQLWQEYYSTGISNVTAAALQIKIWEIVDFAVGNGTFSLLSIFPIGDSAAVTAAILDMNTFLVSNPNAPTATLAAVTGPGQDYVIAYATPEAGASLLLFGAAFAGLAVLRRRFAS